MDPLRFLRIIFSAGTLFLLINAERELACFQRRATNVPGDYNMSHRWDKTVNKAFAVKTTVACWGRFAHCYGYVMKAKMADGKMFVRKELNCGRRSPKREEARWRRWMTEKVTEGKPDVTPTISLISFTCKINECNTHFIATTTTTTTTTTTEPPPLLEVPDDVDTEALEQKQVPDDDVDEDTAALAQNQGNDEDEVDDEEDEDEESSTSLVIGITTGLTLLLIIIGIIVWCVIRRRAKQEEEDRKSSDMNNNHRNDNRRRSPNHGIGGAGRRVVDRTSYKYKKVSEGDEEEENSKQSGTKSVRNRSDNRGRSPNGRKGGGGRHKSFGRASPKYEKVFESGEDEEEEEGGEGYMANDVTGRNDDRSRSRNNINQNNRNDADSRASPKYEKALESGEDEEEEEGGEEHMAKSVTGLNDNRSISRNNINRNDRNDTDGRAFHDNETQEDEQEEERPA